MAVFGVGESDDIPEECAVYTGQEILESINNYPRLGSQVIQLGIGINTGKVAAGYAGTQQRTEFNVLGDSVNVAFALSTIARPDRIMIGQKTAKALGDKFTLKTMGDQKLKGRENPTTIIDRLTRKEIPNHRSK